MSPVLYPVKRAGWCTHTRQTSPCHLLLWLAGCVQPRIGAQWIGQ